MAKETLSIPEEHLADVIKVIRCGLIWNRCMVHPEVEKMLNQWIEDEEAYLKRLQEP